MRRAYEAHGRLVYNLCRHALGHPQHAEDALREVFLRAWRSRGDYEPSRPLARWLTEITWRVLLDGTTARFRPDGSGGREALRRIAVHDALDHLSAPQAQILRMAFVQSLPSAEIAERMHLSLEAVRWHLSRGLVALRRAGELPD